jgi:hypothetical protein
MRASDVQQEIDRMTTTRIVTDSNGRKHITTEPLLHPPQRTWVGLTDEGISYLWSWSMTREAELTATTQQHAFARAIEAKLKELNG